MAERALFRRLQLSLPAALVSMIVAVMPVYADMRDWWSSTESWSLSTMVYDTRTADDTYRARTIMYWDATRASNLGHMTGSSHSAYRFSDDIHDRSCHLSATSRKETNLRDPYFDRDYKACYDYLYRYDEAEITAQSSAAPTAGVGYWTNFYFTRWASNQAKNVWRFDTGSGTLTYDETLSEQLSWTADKWDTIGGGGCCAHIGTRNYGTVAARPSTAAAGALGTETQGTGLPLGEDPSGEDPDVEDPDVAEPSSANSTPLPSEFTVALSPSAAAAPTRLEGFTLSTTGDPGEVLILPELDSGLDAYADAARGLAIEVVEAGPARAVLTFSRPLSAAEVAALVDMGLQLTSVEAVSAEAADGTRITAGDAYSEEFMLSLPDIGAEYDADMLGVVSAEGVILDVGVLDNLYASGDVWLVDVSLEQVGRSHPNLVDVVMNDLYWKIAGWD